MALDIVLTNDDGYQAPGIQTLYEALTAAGHQVSVVAPLANQSAQGTSLGGVQALTSPIDVVEFSPGNYTVDGRPIVATGVALGYLFADDPPDLVVSGTNRGENVGLSVNISGTVGAAVGSLLLDVPAIAVSAGADAEGAYDAAYANAGDFLVGLLDTLEAARFGDAPLLPPGLGLNVNVPGDPEPDGVAVTRVDQETSAYYPIVLRDSGLYGSQFTRAEGSSGDPLSEGAQFLLDRITVSPIDGDWTASPADRASLEARLAGRLDDPTPTVQPLDIMLVNDDGYLAPGLAAAREALLAAGHEVTVVAPAVQQSGVGTALTLQDFFVVQYEAGYVVTATPTTTVYTALDALLTGEDRPDLVVSGINEGANVGPVAVSSGTVSAAVAAVFNYGLPAIAVSAGTDAAGRVPDGLYELGADVLVELIADLQATARGDGAILPDGVGLNVNLPVGASADRTAFTVLDEAAPVTIGVAQSQSLPGQPVVFVFGGPVNTDDPFSEGTNFNEGDITITPIDGNFSSDDLAAYELVAGLLGTRFGQPTTEAMAVM